MLETFDGLPPMVAPSTGSTIAFVAIVIVLVALFVFAVRLSWVRSDGPDAARRAARWARVGIFSVLVATVVLAQSGALASLANGPEMMIYFAACNGGALVLALSPVGRRMADHLPLWGLVGFQAFRFPLELVLHQWYQQGVLPIQMTYEGHNYDIITGVLAIAVGLTLYRGSLGRYAAWAFNVLGLLLLINVGQIAVRSSPVPFRSYMNDPVVLLAFYPPYTWILPVCVAGALFGHVVTFRKLLRDQPAHALA